MMVSLGSGDCARRCLRKGWGGGYLETVSHVATYQTQGGRWPGPLSVPCSMTLEKCDLGTEIHWAAVSHGLVRRTASSPAGYHLTVPRGAPRMEKGPRDEPFTKEGLHGLEKGEPEMKVFEPFPSP